MYTRMARVPASGDSEVPTGRRTQFGSGGAQVLGEQRRAGRPRYRLNWIQTDPEKSWNTILRFYSPLQPFFDKTWRPSEIELVS